MKSFDIFDTLIGRWYCHPRSIFEEIERLGIRNFVNDRVNAEILSRGENFDKIYEQYQIITSVSDIKRDNIKNLEFRLEKERSFPIVENVKKLELDSLIISDMYYGKEKLRELLFCNGISKYKDIYCGIDIKRSGRIWNTVKPNLHLDDNPYVCDVARREGIPVEQYNNHMFTENETFLINSGFYFMACLCRMLRLSNPYDDTHKQIWYEQTQGNIPFLLLFSNYIHDFAKNKGFSKILFTERDCINLYNIFKAQFSDLEISLFSTSRNAYGYKDAEVTQSFIDYVKNTYTPNSLIIDMFGSGYTCFTFFRKYLNTIPNYFSAVHYDYNYGEIFPALRLVSSSDGFFDKIEKVNYSNLGRLIDVKEYAIREKNIINEYIETQLKVISMAEKFIKNGFFLEQANVPSIDIMKYFLRYIEKNCKISEVVNHWII